MGIGLNSDASGIGKYWMDDISSQQLPSPCYGVPILELRVCEIIFFLEKLKIIF